MCVTSSAHAIAPECKCYHVHTILRAQRRVQALDVYGERGEILLSRVSHVILPGDAGKKACQRNKEMACATGAESAMLRHVRGR